MSKDSLPQSDDAVLGPYKELHKPSSSFASRDEYLNHELQIM